MSRSTSPEGGLFPFAESDGLAQRRVELLAHLLAVERKRQGVTLPGAQPLFRLHRKEREFSDDAPLLEALVRVFRPPRPEQPGLLRILCVTVRRLPSRGAHFIEPYLQLRGAMPPRVCYELRVVNQISVAVFQRRGAPSDPAQPEPLREDYRVPGRALLPMKASRQDVGRRASRARRPR